MCWTGKAADWSRLQELKNGDTTTRGSTWHRQVKSTFHIPQGLQISPDVSSRKRVFSDELEELMRLSKRQETLCYV